MKYAIITGVSKGLGESVGELFLESGINVIGISRNNNTRLSKIAEENRVIYKHYSCDLGNTKVIEETLESIYGQLFSNDPTLIYLINNAAVLEPIDQAMNINNADLEYHVQVNMIAPMILMNSLLKKTTEFEISFVGVTITSGAGERPVYGWSAYCSTKASMNIYTKTVALEQYELGTDNKIIAFNPGIMDTDMQARIRESSRDAFIEIETFKDYKKHNDLRDTDVIGEILFDILTDQSTIENGKIYSVKDYL